MLGLNQISLAVNRLLGPGEPAAALDLNFLSGSLDSRITFTRTSTATRYNSSGLLETVASGSPRFDYDPVTLAAKGLLIEESRKNLLLQSQDLSYFTTIDGVTAGTGGTPSSGSGSYKRITAVAGNTAHYAQNTGVDFSATAGTAYAFSIEVQYVDQRWVGLSWYDGGFSSGCTFDLLNGTVGTNAGVFTGAITPLGSGRYRISVKGTATSTGTIWVALVLLDSDKAFSTITASNLSATKVDASFAQVEAGSFPTSYIPTTTAAVTRAADAVSMTGTNFSSWYNSLEGTFVTEAATSSVVPGIRSLALFVSSGSDQYTIRHGYQTNVANSFTSLITDNYQPYGESSGTLVSPTKFATAYSSAGAANTVNSSSVVTTTVTVSASVNQLNIGSRFGTGAFFNGHIKQLRYYNTRKSNAELQTLTT